MRSDLINDGNLDEIIERVGEALRQWHAEPQAPSSLGDLLLYRQTAAALAERQIILSPRLVSNRLLLDALAELGSHNSQFEVLLRQRFLDRVPARAVAGRLHLSERTFYHRQTQAIRELAQIIFQKEQTARHDQARAIEVRLPPPTFSRIFGVTEKQADLKRALLDEDRFWLIVIEGLGGIGKTSLALSTLLEVMWTTRFHDIAWVSAHQHLFDPWGEVQVAAPPALTLERLAEEVGEQLGWLHLLVLPPPEQWTRLVDQLKRQPYLIVIDNLETAADYAALVPHLKSAAKPSKFLLTSRHGPRPHHGFYHLRLDELNQADALALIRYEAEERGIQALAAAPPEALAHIYEVVGGNPLALKLVIGQVYTTSLSEVLAGLQWASGKKAEELYAFIYRRAWDLLDEDARLAWLMMPLVARQGGTLQQLQAASGLVARRARAALERLVRLCLVDAGGRLEARRYSIHRLTETFLLSEVAKW
ncbi:MAG: NB-ARC domain-containing protein [Anaerolineae bacterium]